jgi:hypothetical protein
MRLLGPVRFTAVFCGPSPSGRYSGQLTSNGLHRQHEASKGVIDEAIKIHSRFPIVAHNQGISFPSGWGCVCMRDAICHVSCSLAISSSA